MKDIMETIELTDFLSDMKLTFSNDEEMSDYFYDYEKKNIKQDKLFLYKRKINNQPYEYITQVEQRGEEKDIDLPGYETFFVFKRKSDGKYFSYYIYEGVIEQCTLTECKEEVRTVWNFECQYPWSGRL